MVRIGLDGVLFEGVSQPFHPSLRSGQAYDHGPVLAAEHHHVGYRTCKRCDELTL